MASSRLAFALAVAFASARAALAMQTLANAVAKSPTIAVSWIVWIMALTPDRHAGLSLFAKLAIKN